MKEYKIITKTVEQKEVIKETCDKCEQQIKSYAFDNYNSEWFEFSVGACYPESTNGVKYFMDLCEECSIKLTQLLKQNGFNIQEKEL